MKRTATRIPTRMSSLLMGIFFILLYCRSLDICAVLKNAKLVPKSFTGDGGRRCSEIRPRTTQLNEFHRYLRSLDILNLQRLNVKKIPNLEIL